MENFYSEQVLRPSFAGEAALCGVDGSVEVYRLKGSWFVKNSGLNPLNPPYQGDLEGKKPPKSPLSGGL